MRLPSETVEDLNAEDTAWRLLELWGVTQENATLERHTAYTFQARWCETWRNGRSLLAGAAAPGMRSAGLAKCMARSVP